MQSICMIKPQKIQINGNGSVEFFAKLRSLVSANTSHKIVILPTQTQGSFLLVRGA